MKALEIRERIKILRNELESRYKYGTVKLANTDGSAIPVEVLQKELYNLIYKLSKLS